MLFGFATSFPKNPLFLVEQLRGHGKTELAFKEVRCCWNRESKNGHEMVAVCQRRPGDVSELLFLIQGGKCALCALYLTAEHLHYTSRAILELFFRIILL